MKLTSTLFYGTVAILSSTVRACDFYHIFDWVDLPKEVQDAAAVLGYEESTWNGYKLNPIEFLAFDEIMSNETTFETPIGTYTKGDGDLMDALTTLDLYDEDFEWPDTCWDFFVNHYGGYTWEEIEDTYNPFGDNVQDLAEILGWTEDMWDNDTFDGDIPESECKLWVELTPEERWALRKMGWFAVSWAETACDPRCPNSLACPEN
eukprot:290299_1